MTAGTMEALDRLEGWLLGFSIAAHEDCAQWVPTALEHIDAIRSAFPTTPSGSKLQP